MGIYITNQHTTDRLQDCGDYTKKDQMMCSKQYRFVVDVSLIWGICMGG